MAVYEECIIKIMIRSPSKKNTRLKSKNVSLKERKIFNMNTLYELVYFTLLISFAIAEEMYTTKFENVDYEEILRSDRLLKNYMNCLLDKGSCTAEGKELKSKYQLL